MVFSSILFLFKFMPLAFLIYYISPEKWRNFTLFVLSLIFYSWGEARYFPLIMVSIFINYVSGLLLDKYKNDNKIRKTIITLSVMFNLGALGYFKYSDFFIENINAVCGTSIPLLHLTLPLGISFYTFQIMSYTIDVYRGKVEAERNFISLGAYVALFPQLIAGPIVKYSDVSNELKSRKITLSMVDEGIQLFVMGLGSKVLIANNMGLLWDEVVRLGFNNISTVLAWLGTIAYGFQVYFDFSGYSLMAIGLGKMLGFNFPKNFDFPFISKSATEFWRRWHMTLGGWFREYLYIPLGGNRVSKSRLMFNTFAVWFCTGFWHGASWNFIFWGMWFFALLMLEKNLILKYLNNSKVAAYLYMFIVLQISWVLFAVTDSSQIMNLFAAMFTFKGGIDWVYYLKNFGITIAIACFAATPAIKILYGKVEHIKAVRCICILGVLLVSTAYLVDASYNPFLYFRF